MARKLTVNSDKSCDEACDIIRADYQAKRFLRISIRAGVDRSGPQNDTIYHIYELIAEWFYEGDIDHARAECKLTIGLPILREGNPDLDQLCSRSIDKLNFEEQMKFIKTMDVSSEMSVEECRKYITRMIDTYAANGMMIPAYLTDESKRRSRK